MTAYEGVLSCYLFAMETFNSSLSEIDAMDLGLLLDLINVHCKITDSASSKSGRKQRAYIDEIL